MELAIDYAPKAPQFRYLQTVLIQILTQGLYNPSLIMGDLEARRVEIVKELEELEYLRNTAGFFASSSPRPHSLSEEQYAKIVDRNDLMYGLYLEDQIAAQELLVTIVRAQVALTPPVAGVTIH
ncbi:hypothetical protein LUCX_103 [Xanthomonas phage vB_XciM_LucasX]|nr:hypothetical protein LUCX_103 [Xanthomonas phage vB_XciM_LucasX]